MLPYRLNLGMMSWVGESSDNSWGQQPDPATRRFGYDADAVAALFKLFHDCDVQRRLSALDGLRGICAASVIIYHSILIVDSHFLTAVLPSSVLSLRGWVVIAKIILSIFNGAISVQVFFVISGFVLRLSFNRLPSNILGAAYEFSVRRIFRLFPAIFACMLFCFLVGVVGLHVCPHCSQFFQTAADLVNVFKNAILLGTNVQQATWTLQVEMLAVPFLILAFAAARITGPVSIIISLIYVSLAFDRPWMLFNATNLIYTLPYFLGGALMAEVEFQKGLRSCSWLSPLILLIILVCMKILLPIADNFILFLANVFITSVAVGRLSALEKVTLFDGRSLQFLGRISYSLYLLNVPIIWIVMLPLPQGHPLGRGLFLGLVVMTLSLPLAALAERFVERPGQNLGRDVLRRFNTARLWDRTNAECRRSDRQKLRRSTS